MQGRAAWILIVCWGIGMFGCSSTGSGQAWPWLSGSQLNEEVVVPPSDDLRFTQPQQYPKEVLTPTLRKEDDWQRPPPFGSSRTMPGVYPGPLR
ncbi:MAG: hypothetical protein C4297_11540 [Gemmataceae bacterium]